jgi:hypothetical protein
MSRVFIGFLSIAAFAAPVMAQVVRPADTLDHARRCAFSRRDKESASAFRTRCAEDFVARNGYTSGPPTSDSTLWATESIEFASSWQQLFQQRRNTLLPKADGAAGCDDNGCAATFRYADPAMKCIWRVVTMSRTGLGMRMQHQEAIPRPGSEEERKCRRR